jgi:hypothetical protein
MPASPYDRLMVSTPEENTEPDGAPGPRTAGASVGESVGNATASGARAFREVRRWSGLPVAASLSLVAFAVLFGVYGPRVVDRGSPSVGTPLWEAADSAVDHLERHVLHAPFRDDQSVQMGEANAALAKILGPGFVCPDLGSHLFAPNLPTSIGLPGAAAAAAVVYSRKVPQGIEYLNLVITPYREQYIVMSDFGKPQFLLPGPAIGVEAAPSDRVESRTLAWSNGTAVYVAVGSRKTTLDEVASDLIPSGAVSRVPD